MQYLSTRGHSAGQGFSDILLEGLAPDGGLYLPTHYPQIDATTLQAWRGLSYADLALEILSLYITDIPRADLQAIVQRTYTPAVFGTREITPLKPLEPGLALLGLSNGPTLAFKDMAMQLLGALFEYELGRRHEELNILGATSGDTGSAAEYAMRGKRGVRVFMLSPHGRMSAFQQAQMFSLQDPNIHNLAIEGVFDDCQDIVKAVSNDLEFKRRYKIGTVNSINWARLLAQVVYYFAGYFQAISQAPRLGFASPPPEGAAPPWGGPAAALAPRLGSASSPAEGAAPPWGGPAASSAPGLGSASQPPEGATPPWGGPAATDLANWPRVSFTVPSGNFGNVCAGHVARMMGLPVDRLVVATNENDVLDEFFKTGTYRVRSSAQTFETSSPSMDISKASNFERFVFDLLGRDAARTRALFKDELEQRGCFTLTGEEFARVKQYGFESGKSTHADRLATIRATWQKHQMMIDTHTADGLKVALEHRDSATPMIVLETALPVKFAETIQEALGLKPPVPTALSGIEARPKRFTVLPAQTQAVKDFIEAHCKD